MSTVVYTSELSVTKGQNLHRLTAKAIIRDWEDGVLSPDSVDHQLKKMDMKDYIIELSKKYSIVTQLTSFIAVEKREKEEERNGDVRQTPWAKVDKTVLSKRVSPPPSKEEDHSAMLSACKVSNK